MRSSSWCREEEEEEQKEAGGREELLLLETKSSFKVFFLSVLLLRKNISSCTDTHKQYRSTSAAATSLSFVFHQNHYHSTQSHSTYKQRINSKCKTKRKKRKNHF